MVKKSAKRSRRRSVRKRLLRKRRSLRKSGGRRKSLRKIKTQIVKRKTHSKGGANPLIEGAELLHTLSGHSEDVYAVAVFADGKKVVSGSADNTVKIWELPTIVGLTQRGQREFDSSDLGYKLPYDLQQKIFEMAEHETRQRGLLTRKEDTKRQERKDYDEELRRMTLLDSRQW